MPKRRILIVDDNVALSQMLKTQLDEIGGFVVEVQNQSTAAIATGREFRPDLAILDVMMPEIDGGHLAALMKEDPILRDVPIIFLTGSVRREEVEGRHGIIGGMPFLAKPAKLDDLLGLINKLAPAAGTAVSARAS